MARHEDTLRDQYSTLISAFNAAFTGIQPPEPSWWMLWLDKYDFADIRAAIQRLSAHPLKARFTQESTGKAISALLREIALRKAVTSRLTPGSRS
jgi:hypothetical protein